MTTPRSRARRSMPAVVVLDGDNTHLANLCGPLHTHDHDLHGLVLRGILRMGFADSTGKVAVREYPAGSFVAVPAGKVHVEGSAVETEIHLSGIGPLVTTVVDSGRTQRCTPTSPE